MDKPNEEQVAYILDQLEGILLAASRGMAYLGLGRIPDILPVAEAVAECASNLWAYVADMEELETVQFTPEAPKSKSKVISLDSKRR